MRRLLFLTAFLLVPSVCAAENVTSWNMVGETKIEGWNTNNLTSVQLIPQGLAVSTQTNGQLIRVSDIRHNVRTISITYLSPLGAEGIFFWRPKDMEGNDVYQIPMNFAPATSSTTVVLDMSQITEWDSRSDRIGFVLNAGSQLVLQKMEFAGPGFTENVIFPLKTLFRFDVARAYSINFLWGPLMTYSQQELDVLFNAFPPNADSWNTVLYALLGIALAVTLILKKVLKIDTLRWLLIFVAVIWVLYDIRMGAELISYANKDMKTWWNQPIELKDFRDRGSFNAFAKTAAPYAEGKERFVFIASHGWPFSGTMKYLTYPATPVSLEGDTEGVDTWIVYNRNDIRIGPDNRLMLNGEPISPPGGIMMDFEPGAFVFVTQQ